MTFLKLDVVTFDDLIHSSSTDRSREHPYVFVYSFLAYGQMKIRINFSEYVTQELGRTGI